VEPWRKLLLGRYRLESSFFNGDGRGRSGKREGYEFEPPSFMFKFTPMDGTANELQVGSIITCAAEVGGGVK
jgi:hypothetical protein